MKLNEFTVEYVADYEDLKPGVILIEADPGEKPWVARFLCPCGCGQEVAAILDTHNILNHKGPVWSLQDDSGSISLGPSVQMLTECKSHFFIKNNQIDWC